MPADAYETKEGGGSRGEVLGEISNTIPKRSNYMQQEEHEPNVKLSHLYCYIPRGGLPMYTHPPHTFIPRSSTFTIHTQILSLRFFFFAY